MCSGVTAYSALSKVGKLNDKQDVVILGCGGVGMMGIQIAKAMFGKAPIAADISDERLEAAKKAGAKAAYNTKDPASAKQMMKDLGGAYAIVDFVGSEATFAFANAAVRKGGKIIIVGLFGGALTIPIPTLPMRGVSIIGSFVSSLKEAEELMVLVRAGKIDPIPVETRPLDAANKTLDDLRAGKITGRVVLTP
jgi:D-arabinose 1-dehydrogenase-like Zn-dependent alcohol dehydrogenase